MNKTLITLLIILIGMCEAQAYTPRTAEMFRTQRKLQYINPVNNQKINVTFKDYTEYEQKSSEKYYCQALPNREYGYLVFKNTFGRVSYVYEEFMNTYSRSKCIPKVDTYPVIHSLSEIKN